MQPWLSGNCTYEGFPLFLRRPEADANTPANRQAFPLLAVCTHTFRERLPNGLPEPTYNEGLEELDVSLTRAFAAPCGVPVLVETFGGARRYYFYVATEAEAAAAFSRIVAAYPGEPLEWQTRSDSGWSFLARYARDFF